MTGLTERFAFTRRLGFRLAALLSVAILPVGLISVVQTMHLARESQRNAEIALLGRTASAAAGERALLQSALGTADALGPAVLENMDDPATCSEMMRNFIERSASYVYAGFVPLSGMANCTSSQEIGKTIDMRDSPAYRQFMTSPTTLVRSLDRGNVSGKAVVIVIHPLYRDRELLGYTAVSLSRELLQSTHPANFDSEGVRIVTFNAQGDLLNWDADQAPNPTAVLPRGVAPVDLLAGGETLFRAEAENGESRVFSVVQVVPGLVYALGSWSEQIAGFAGVKLSRGMAILVPILLWAASLGVAYFAVYRLVLRHIRVLRGQMRRFAIGDRDEPPPVLTEAPAEIADVSQTFHNMARILIRDEEAMEEAVAEKTVLLKEVHHRVKNNLQLIASIINMQSRVIDHDDAKRVLRSVQDRVSALATIYRNLYQAEHLDSVDADRLIGDIINHMANASAGMDTGLRVETRLDPLTLLPDQAVPLSLLATEAFTNALKYAGVPPGQDHAWVKVSLTSDGPGRATLEVINSIGNSDNAESEGTGLGSQLIEAFATQLNGEAELGSEGDSFVLRLPFQVERVSERDATDLRNVVLTSAARAGSQH